MPETQTESTVTQSAPASAQGSASEPKTQGVTGGSVDTAQKQPVKEAGLPKGAEVEFFKLRQAKRDLQSENAALQSRLEALEKKVVTKRSEETWSESQESDAPKIDRDEIARQVSEQVKEDLRREQAKYQLEIDTQEANKWLRSRSHIADDPNAAREIGEILATNPRYARLQFSDPIAAGKAAYLDWCEEKGVDPDLKKHSATPPAYASSGVRPSNAGQSADKGFITGADIAAAFKKLVPNSPEWKAKRDEIDRAIREGRYKAK